MVDSTVLGFALSRALIVVPFTIWLQRYYAGKNTSITTHIVCFISWSLAFSMVYILPLDLIPTTSEALYTVWYVHRSCLIPSTVLELLMVFYTFFCYVHMDSPTYIGICLSFFVSMSRSLYFSRFFDILPF